MLPAGQDPWDFGAGSAMLCALNLAAGKAKPSGSDLIVSFIPVVKNAFDQAREGALAPDEHLVSSLPSSLSARSINKEAPWPS